MRAANQKAWAQVGAVPFTKKCLDDPKVRHDGTDERDPNFCVYHDIQQQNDFAVLQLNAMGYDGDLLRAEFRPDKILERMDAEAAVTVPQTRERQDALAAAHNAGMRFFATGGGTHLTDDDIFIGIEMGDRKKRVVELERDRKKRLDFFQKRDAALIVLDRLNYNEEGNLNKLSDDDLKKLLMWKGVSVTRVTKPDKLALWKKL